MLITTCSLCQARFRVTPQQLNARQGHVRCGKCNQVFNGFQSLERFPDDDTGARLLAAEQARERQAALRAATDEAERGPPTTPHAVEETMPELESVAPPSPSPVPAAQALPGSISELAPPSRMSVREGPPDDTPQLTLEEPPRRPVSRAWAFGVVLLLLVIALEAAFAFRGPVAQRYPPLRPALEAACGPLRCTVPYAREDGLLKLEDSEMLEVPGKPGEIALGARIRNLASVAQEFPHLELTLTDNSGQAAARRVLRPTDYLGRPLSPGEVISPGVELALQVRLQTSNLKPTGYELLLFYP